MNIHIITTVNIVINTEKVYEFTKKTQYIKNNVWFMKYVEIILVKFWTLKYLNNI